MYCLGCGLDRGVVVRLPLLSSRVQTGCGGQHCSCPVEGLVPHEASAWSVKLTTHHHVSRLSRTPIPPARFYDVVRKYRDSHTFNVPFQSTFLFPDSLFILVTSSKINSKQGDTGEWLLPLASAIFTRKVGVDSTVWGWPTAGRN